MSQYGVTRYGESTYGLDAPPAYLCANFQATSTGYDRILVTWKKPTSGSIFRYRLLTSRFGYPVNENDGVVAMDSAVYPASSYLDLQVIPGSMHYYAMYVQVDTAPVTWMRSGITACLATADYGSTKWMMSLIPEWFKFMPDGGSLPLDANGKSDLYKFVDVMAWGLNTLRTQYGMLDKHINDPLAIQPADLWNMAAELGMTFSPEIEAATVRKAVANWAYVCRERGTLLGIRNEINLRTGWGADVQIGQNMLLEDDQAQFLSPIFMPYNPTHTYRKNECVWRTLLYYNGIWPRGYWSNIPFPGLGHWYRCTVEGTRGIDPPTDGSSNGNWTAILDEDDTLSTLTNVRTDNPSTWEMLDSTATSGAPPIGSLTQGLGVQAPGQDSTHKAWNALRFYNHHGSPSSFMLRSVSRRHGTVGQIPDSSFEAGYTIADPKAERRSNSASWVPSSWPRVWTPISSTSPTYNNNFGGYFTNFQRPVSVPAYWTCSNATIDLSMLHPHTGSWSAVVGTDITAPPGTYQFPNPGFTTGVAGWSAYNCTIQQSALGGSPCALITPQAVPNPYAESSQITVTPGTSITVTSAMQGPVAVSVALRLNWYDVNGVEISTSNGTPSNCTTTSWKTYTVTGTAPSNAATMSLIATYNTTPALGSIVYLNAVVVSYPGLVSTASVSSPWVKCPAGTSCTGSLWAYAPTTLDTAIKAALQWFDHNGHLVSSSNGSAALPTATVWTNYTATGTSPSGAVYVALALVYTTPQSVDTVYLDDTTLAAGLSYDSLYPPEKTQSVQDGLPVPWTMSTQTWDPLKEYATNDLVLWEGQSFTALRASTGAVPPHDNTPTTEWAPLSYDRRIRLMVSGMTSQNMTVAGNQTAKVVPFVEWFDAWGNWIARVFARNPNSGGGVEARPDQLAFDSFTTPSATHSGTINITPWTASFYNNITLSGSPVLTRTDPVIDFTWYSASPAAGVNPVSWSAKWTGTFTAPATGVYTFGVSSSDGSKVKVNGTTVVDNWNIQENTYKQGTISLTSGATTTVEVDYYKGSISSNNTVYKLDLDPDLWDDGWPWWWGGLRDFQEAPFGLGWGRPFEDYYARTRVFKCKPGATVVASIPCLYAGPGALYLHWYDKNGRSLGSTEGKVSRGWYQRWTPLTVTDVAPPKTAHVVVGSMLQFYFGVQDSEFYEDTYVNRILGDFSEEGIIAVQPIRTNSSNHRLVGVIIRRAGGGNELIRYAYPRWEFMPWCWMGIGTVTIEDVVWSGVQFNNDSPVSWVSQTGGPDMNGRFTDDRGYTWSVPTGAFMTGGYAGGTAWPAVPATRSVAVLTGAANCQVGVTFRTAPATDQGLVFRYSSDTNYWLATRTALKKKVSGTWSTVGSYSTAFNTGDRIVANLNGNVITIYRNGVSVYTVTDTFNASATKHGIEAE